MKRTDYKCFSRENFLEQDKFEKIMNIKDEYATRNGFIVEKDGTVKLNKDSISHVRNHGSNHNLLKVYNQDFYDLLMLIRDELVKEGVANPRLNGVQFYRNFPSMAWHKDFNYDNTPDHLRWSLFFILFPNTQEEGWEETLTISHNREWPNMWNLGMRSSLKGNLLLGHNQLLGHEFVRKGNPANYNDILGMVWYDGL